MDVIQKKLHFSSPQMIIFGFILVNLMGCLLLMLPSSTVEKGRNLIFGCIIYINVSNLCDRIGDS